LTHSQFAFIMRPNLPKGHRMRLLQCFKIFFLLCVVMLLASCASTSGNAQQGRLSLAHRDLIVANFQNLGPVKIQKFIDYRPMNERMLGSDDDDLTQQASILSIDTDIPVEDYLQAVLNQEVQRTGIFTVGGEPKYQLTGIIYSMAVGTTTEKHENPLFDEQGKMEANQVVQENYYFANVKFMAVLKQDNKVVFRKIFSARETRPIHPPLNENEQSRLLDVAVTKAVAQMFIEMEQKFKLRGQQ